MRDTHVDFTENDVYNAANNDEGIKHVPGIPHITLHKGAGRVQIAGLTKGTKTITKKYLVSIDVLLFGQLRKQIREQHMHDSTFSS